MEDPHGWNNFWKLFASGLWEPETKEFMHSILQPGDLFVDVGAWIGPTVRWALEVGASVIAIEPDPVALPELRRIPGIEVWPGAVGTELGVGYLATNPKEGGALGDSMSRLGSEGYQVAIWPLDYVLHRRRPRLVKIDVEGYEIDLCPVLMPWLSEIGACVQVSCHGAIPATSCFDGFDSVSIPEDSWGDIRCVMER